MPWVRYSELAYQLVNKTEKEFAKGANLHSTSYQAVIIRSVEGQCLYVIDLSRQCILLFWEGGRFIQALVRSTVPWIDDVML